LNALAGSRQHIVGDGGRRRWRSLRRRRQSGLQGPYRSIERQAMRLQHLRGGAAPISDDGGEHDRPVDVASPAAARGSSSRFQNPPHVLRYPEAYRCFGRIGFGVRKLPDDVGLERCDVDVARVENCDGVAIIAKRRQHVL
jgi:hypothetical protein